MSASRRIMKSAATPTPPHKWEGSAGAVPQNKEGSVMSAAAANGNIVPLRGRGAALRRAER